MRLFLDANILFSAAYRERNSVRIFFKLAGTGICELVSSPYAIDEARRNIMRKHPERVNDLDRLIGELRICAEAGAVEIAWALTQQLPGKDAPILAAAVQANSMLLVTGDHRDFGHLFGKTLRGTQVLPPVATLERIIGR